MHTRSRRRSVRGGLGTRKKLGALLADSGTYRNVVPEIKKAILDNAILLITLSKKGAWAPIRNSAKWVGQTINFTGVPTAVVAAGVFATLAAIPVIGLPIAIIGGILAFAGSAVVGAILFAAVGEAVGFPEDSKADIRKWKTGVLESTKNTLEKYNAMSEDEQRKAYADAKAKADEEIANAKRELSDKAKAKTLQDAVVVADKTVAVNDEAEAEAEVAAAVVEGPKATDLYTSAKAASKPSTVLPTAPQSRVSSFLPPAAKTAGRKLKRSKKTRKTRRH